jgi:UDP-N-acetylmuramyl pentapeptide synthase
MQLKPFSLRLQFAKSSGHLIAVESIAYDSRRVQRHTLFVAMRGEKSDGHQFIDQAIEKGRR